MVHKTDLDGPHSANPAGLLEAWLSSQFGMTLPGAQPFHVLVGIRLIFAMRRETSLADFMHHFRSFGIELLLTSVATISNLSVLGSA